MTQLDKGPKALNQRGTMYCVLGTPISANFLEIFMTIRPIYDTLSLFGKWHDFCTIISRLYNWPMSALEGLASK